MARVLSSERSLTDRRRVMSRERRILQHLMRIEAGLAAVLLAVGLWHFLRHGSHARWWPGLAMTVVALAHRLRARQSAREEMWLGVGLRGETDVSRRFAGALGDDHAIFNDVLARDGRRTAQIDHLVIGPGGVFLIETKNWRGLVAGDEDSPAWTQTRQPGEKPLRLTNPVRQSKRHVRVVRAALDRAGLDAAPLHPLIVMCSPKTKLDVPALRMPVLDVEEAIRHVREAGPDRGFDAARAETVIRSWAEARR